MVSSYINPENSDLNTMMASIEDHLDILKNGDGFAYLPEWDYNGIGDWDFKQGYQLKISEPDLITIQGAQIQPELHTIHLNQGWSIISYLRQTPADASEVFEDIIADIVLIKNSEGLAYLPEWDYNGIGDLLAGQGYQIKVSSNTELHYLAND